MTLFDLLFLLLALAALLTLLLAAVDALRGRRAQAAHLLKRLGIAAAAYFAIVLLVAAFSPQRYVDIGDDQCADDWCIAVGGVTPHPAAGSQTAYDVAFTLSSRARRVDQRERYVVVYLRDANGNRYDPVPQSGDVPFDTLLHPGESIAATRRFIVPAGARIDGIIIAREGGGRIPGCCIIGDESSFFHKHTIVRIR